MICVVIEDKRKEEEKREKVNIIRIGLEHQGGLVNRRCVAHFQASRCLSRIIVSMQHLFGAQDRKENTAHKRGANIPSKSCFTNAIGSS